MNRLSAAVVAAAAFWVAACGGGGGGTVAPPPPTGKFTDGSLSGTYAFMTSGEVLDTSTGTSVPMVRVGSFVADGNGHITGGVEDVNISQIAVTTAATIASGSSYTINDDGRGTLTLNVISAGISSTVNFGIVLTSGSSGPPSVATGGLMMDETTTSQVSTGSGNFLQQNTAVFQTTTVNGNYVFDFSGLDSTGAPASIVGEVATTSGSLTGGVEDANDSGNLTTAGPILSGTFTSDPSNTGTLTSSGRGLVTINGETFAFYIVDASRVRLISIAVPGGSTPDMLSGDAVMQPSVPAAPSGSFAFLVAGSSANGGITRVARFTVSGSTVSKILMDTNNATAESEANTFSNETVNYDTTTGRGVLSFQQNATNVFSFVFYLSSSASGVPSGVIQEVSPNDTSPAFDVADGTIAAQAAGPFSSSNITGAYVVNWSGLVTAGGSIGSTDEEDFLSQVTVSNLSLSGTGDIFQFTGLSLNTNFGVGGSINFNGGDGTGDDGKAPTMTVIVGSPHVDTVVYIVSPQLAFFANNDNNGTPRIVAGVMQAQGQ